MWCHGLRVGQSVQRGEAGPASIIALFDQSPQLEIAYPRIEPMPSHTID
ncbi:MAG: hypothetical protein Ct9H300mP19_09590 [Dehalococcoidia bacterium]|nr:MAG: hypothetical protein Ct9H300mP19_09590 [Dehalococcoidia bacterium]